MDAILMDGEMTALEIRSIRKQAGLKQIGVSELLGLDVKYVGMMERGQATISRRTALAMRLIEARSMAEGR